MAINCRRPVTKDDVEVKLCQGANESETFILCRSAGRLEKDRAIRERFAERIRERLEALGRRLEHTRKPADRSQVERQIGRFLEKNSRAAGQFQIDVTENKSVPAGLRLAWCERADGAKWADVSDGAYILRSPRLLPGLRSLEDLVGLAEESPARL